MGENAPQPHAYIEALKLRETEAQFRAVFENSPIGIVVTDAHGRFATWNRAFRELIGYDDDELATLNVREVTHPDDLAASVEGLRDLAGGKRDNFRLENRYVRKDRRVIVAQTSGTVVQDSGGAAPRIFAMIEDITERKQAEEALGESEELFRQIGENLQKVLFVVDQKDYRVLYVNPTYAQVWGRTCESLYKHPSSWLDSIVAEDRDRVNRALEQQLQTGEFNEVFRIARADQSVRWIHDRVFPIRNDEGEIYRLVGIAEDITERKQAEERLYEYQQRLRSLASEVSLAEERERRRIAADLHDHIIQELALSRIKLGELLVSPRLRSTPCPLQDEIREVVGIVEKVIKETRSLVFELSPPVLYELGFGPAVEWLADRMQNRYGIVCRVRNDEQPKPLDDDVKVVLFQAVRELLNNVAKHAKARRVEISLRRENDRIQIHVKDNGIGFDTSVVGAHASQAGGFGLFSIRERLGLFAGQLVIESAPGRGTRITLEVPLRG